MIKQTLLALGLMTGVAQAFDQSHVRITTAYEGAVRVTQVVDGNTQLSPGVITDTCRIETGGQNDIVINQRCEDTRWVDILDLPEVHGINGVRLAQYVATPTGHLNRWGGYYEDEGHIQREGRLTEELASYETSHERRAEIERIMRKEGNRYMQRAARFWRLWHECLDPNTSAERKQTIVDHVGTSNSQYIALTDGQQGLLRTCIATAQ